MYEDTDWTQALGAAQERDAADPLRAMRARFHLPKGIIYLDGNSLGPAPVAALVELAGAAREEWAEGLIGSWNKAGWFDMPTRYGDMLAPIIGADPGEVVICDTTSMNIYKTVQAALNLRPERRVIVAEGAGFPTDLYVIDGVMATRPDLQLRLEGEDGDDLLALIDGDVAVVLVNQVDYRTGRLRDLRAVTARAHEVGALAIWDLCHSAGALEVGLNAGGADMAVGCGYKYLNGGPGAPAYVFAAKRHLEAIRQPLTGWWGHARPFDFDAAFAPDPGIRKFLCGTQPILSFRVLQSALAIFVEVEIAEIRRKSIALSEAFITMVEASCAQFGVRLLSPRAAAERGSQVALVHPEGHAVVQALIARGVIGDFRAPDVMRFGFAPLYIGHADVVRAARTLHQVLACETWRAERYRARAAVT
jgi:kynureninase